MLLIVCVSRLPGLFRNIRAAEASRADGSRDHNPERSSNPE